MSASLPRASAWLFAFVTVLSLPGIALAQNAGNGGTTFAGMQQTTRPEEFLGKFVELARADAQANASLLTALGDADGASRVSAALDSLDINATPAQITAATDANRAARQKVAALLAAQPVLDDANKALFADGATRLASTAHGFTLLTKNIHSTRQDLTSAGSPARIALFAARGTPDISAQLRGELGSMLAFASARQLTLAPEVGAAASEM